MTRLIVEVEDFVDSAVSMRADVGEPLAAAVNRLDEALFAARGMAGGDPAGQAWAAAYDPAARAAVGAFAALVDGCLGLATLFGQSARNYAQADAASTADVRIGVESLVARLPPAGNYGAAVEPPSALGSGGGPPSGWGLVHYLIPYVWPNGHQDRLRHAEHAWYAASAAVDEAANLVECQPICFAGHHLPEAPDIAAVCAGAARHLRECGHALRVLAGACGDYAQCLDDAHRDVEADLGELVAWTTATEAASALLAPVSFGTSEVAGQAVEADRIAAAAADIAGALARFASRAADAALALPPVQDLCADITAALGRLRSVEIVRPALTGVPGLPRALPMLRVGEGGELGAAARLGRDATRTMPPTLVGRSLGSAGRWAKAWKLGDHFDRHGPDFDASNSADYVTKSTDFLQRAYVEGLPMKIDEDGIIRVFDPATNTFGSYLPDGSTLTFFKPRSPTYWLRQPGVPA